MINLETTYLGLTLHNPLIVGASPLTRSAAAIRKCADAGAGAVVVKSLFEEQIRAETDGLQRTLESEESWHSEVYDYMNASIGMRYGTRDYLKLIQDAKQSVEIPVIASINCISPEWWQDFAREVAAAGADALELNLGLMPTELTRTSEEIEKQYVDIMRYAREAVNIPIAVKLGPYCTSLPRLIIRLRQAGADGFVLFNRFYRPTIDIEDMKIIIDRSPSSRSEASVELRWISLLANRIPACLAATSGVHTGEDLIRLLLAGADAVQAVSTFYCNGLGHLRTMLCDLTTWMESKAFADIAQFRGLLSQANNPDCELYSRVQYMTSLSQPDQKEKR